MSVARPTLRSVFVVVVALLSVRTSAAKDAPVQLALDGVLGERVHLGPPEQARPTIVFFMSRRAREASSAFARAVDEKLLNAPFDSVSIVDLRPYAGVLRRIATSYLRKSADEALTSRRERRVAHGIDASPEFVNRWHLVGDFDGKLFDRFGVTPEPTRPLAIVLDRTGAAHGPFSDVPSLLAACSTLGTGAR